MIDMTHELSVVKQTGLLSLSRGNVYHLPRATSPADLAVMSRIDELYLD